MTEIKINEIVLFQFNKKDKHKIYAHARKCNISMNLFNKKSFLLSIYIPKKKILNADMILDMEDCESFLKFIRQLKNNGIKTHIKVYESSRYMHLDN